MRLRRQSARSLSPGIVERQHVIRMADINRRRWLQIAGAGFPLAMAQPRKSYRVALIAGSGNEAYGHGWDVAWGGLESVSVVAVASPDETARRRGAQRSRAQRTYADYHEMLEKEHPDFVSICS